MYYINYFNWVEIYCYILIYYINIIYIYIENLKRIFSLIFKKYNNLKVFFLLITSSFIFLSLYYIICFLILSSFPTLLLYFTSGTFLILISYYLYNIFRNTNYNIELILVNFIDLILRLVFLGVFWYMFGVGFTYLGFIWTPDFLIKIKQTTYNNTNLKIKSINFNVIIDNLKNIDFNAFFNNINEINFKFILDNIKNLKFKVLLTNADSIILNADVSEIKPDNSDGLQVRPNSSEGLQTKPSSEGLESTEETKKDKGKEIQKAKVNDKLLKTKLFNNVQESMDLTDSTKKMVSDKLMTSLSESTGSNPSQDQNDLYNETFTEITNNNNLSEEQKSHQIKKLAKIFKDNSTFISESVSQPTMSESSSKLPKSGTYNDFNSAAKEYRGESKPYSKPYSKPQPHILQPESSKTVKEIGITKEEGLEDPLVETKTGKYTKIGNKLDETSSKVSNNIKKFFKR